MTDEMRSIVLEYLTKIDAKLDVLLRELVEARRTEVASETADLADARSAQLGELLDRLAAMPEDERCRDVERANEFVRERMAEQPGVPFVDLDLSERRKH